MAPNHGFLGDLGDTHLLACQWSGWIEDFCGKLTQKAR